MITLSDTPFLQSVKKCCESRAVVDADEFRGQYDEFEDALGKVLEQDLSPIEKLRCLKSAQIELSLFVEDVAPEHHGKYAGMLIPAKKALANLKFEIEVTIILIRHPDIATKKISEPISPLFWSDEFTQTDLVELITSIHETKCVRTKAGKPASMEALTRLFEIAFNVKFNQVRALRASVLVRKEKLTSFLDRLRQSIIDLVQR